MIRHIPFCFLCVAVVLPGCATVRSVVHHDDDSCSDPSVCQECGASPNCGAPGCYAPGPFMDHSMMQTYPQSAATSETMPSALPAPELQLPPASASSEAEQWAPRTAWVPPNESNAASSAAACEAQLAAARAEFTAKLEALETRFEAEKEAKKSLSSSLNSVNNDVSRLAREVEFWRDEVRRIDRTTELQHQSDMASLQSISKMIETIRPSSASTSGR